MLLNFLGVLQCYVKTTSKKEWTKSYISLFPKIGNLGITKISKGINSTAIVAKVCRLNNVISSSKKVHYSPRKEGYNSVSESHSSPNLFDCLTIHINL